MLTDYFSINTITVIFISILLNFCLNIIAHVHVDQIILQCPVSCLIPITFVRPLVSFQGSTLRICCVN